MRRPVKSGSSDVVLVLTADEARVVYDALVSKARSLSAKVARENYDVKGDPLAGMGYQKDKETALRLYTKMSDRVQLSLTKIE